MSSWPAFAWHFASEPARVPLRLVVGHQRKLRGENPPFAIERQVSTFHAGQGDILPLADLADVLFEASA